jgi:hypothetical protein
VAVSQAPECAEVRVTDRTSHHRIPILIATALAALMLATIGLATPVAANGREDQADRVTAAVSRQIGKPYRWGSTGPNGFDCSGLVYRAFRQAKLARKIGGFNTAHGYFASFRRKGRTSRANPRPGDIVVWDNGGHVGIYVGHGKAVSALLSGVKRHTIRGLNIRFTTYIHLGLDGGTSTVASRSRPKAYRTTTRRLPLRTQPGRSSNVVRSVAKGKRLQVLKTRDRGRKGVWVKVRLSGGDTGWARKSMTRKD